MNTPASRSPTFPFLWCLKTALCNYNSPLLHSAEAFLPYLKLSENPRVQSKIVKSKHQFKMKTVTTSGRTKWNAIVQLFWFFSINSFNIYHFTLKYRKQNNQNPVKADISNTNWFESTIFTSYIHMVTHTETLKPDTFITGNS